MLNKSGQLYGKGTFLHQQSESGHSGALDPPRDLESVVLESSAKPRLPHILVFPVLCVSTHGTLVFSIKKHILLLSLQTSLHPESVVLEVSAKPSLGSWLLNWQPRLGLSEDSRTTDFLTSN